MSGINKAKSSATTINMAQFRPCNMLPEIRRFQVEARTEFTRSFLAWPPTKNNKYQVVELHENMVISFQLWTKNHPGDVGPPRHCCCTNLKIQLANKRFAPFIGFFIRFFKQFFGCPSKSSGLMIDPIWFNFFRINCRSPCGWNPTFHWHCQDIPFGPPRLEAKARRTFAMAPSREPTNPWLIPLKFGKT